MSAASDALSTELDASLGTRIAVFPRISSYWAWSPIGYRSSVTTMICLSGHDTA
jgi:hypothetical protein